MTQSSLPDGRRSWAPFAMAFGLIVVGSLLWVVGMESVGDSHSDAIARVCLPAAPFVGGARGIWLLLLVARGFWTGKAAS